MNRFDNWRKGKPWREGAKAFVVTPNTPYSFDKINHAIRAAKVQALAGKRSHVTLNVEHGPYIFEFVNPYFPSSVASIFIGLPTMDSGVRGYLRAEWK